MNPELQKLLKFQELNHLCYIKGHEKLALMGRCSFYIGDVGKLHKFIVTADNGYYEVTEVPEARGKSFYRMEDVLDHITQFYKDKNISLQKTNAMVYMEWLSEEFGKEKTQWENGIKPTGLDSNLSWKLESEDDSGERLHKKKNMKTRHLIYYKHK